MTFKHFLIGLRTILSRLSAVGIRPNFLVFKPVMVRHLYHDSLAIYHKNTVQKVAFVDAEHQKNFRKLNRSCIWLLYAKMITNMPLRTYETYYLDYLFSNRKFTAIFLTSRRLHGMGTVPVP